MMKREDIIHFGAGPASLPSDVLATAAAALQNYDDTGLWVHLIRVALCHWIPCIAMLTSPRGVAEHSHRSGLAANILATMKADLANFLDIPPSYDILIMQGASNTPVSCLPWIDNLKAEVLASLTRRSTIVYQYGSRGRGKRYWKIKGLGSMGRRSAKMIW
jgi:phosphoserine aminotransferase